MLTFYQEKYGLSDIGHTVFALTYFNDSEEADAPEMLWQVDWDEVKRTLERWVRDYVNTQPPPRPGA